MCGLFLLAMSIKKNKNKKTPRHFKDYKTDPVEGLEAVVAAAAESSPL